MNYNWNWSHLLRDVARCGRAPTSTCSSRGWCWTTLRGRRARLHPRARASVRMVGVVPHPAWRGRGGAPQPIGLRQRLGGVVPQCAAAGADVPMVFRAAGGGARNPSALWLKQSLHQRALRHRRWSCLGLSTSRPAWRCSCAAGHRGALPKRPALWPAPRIGLTDAAGLPPRPAADPPSASCCRRSAQRAAELHQEHLGRPHHRACWS